MGGRIGIIAGTGKFPVLVARELKKQAKELFVLAVEPEADPELAALASVFRYLPPWSLAVILDFIKANKLEEVLLAGKVNPAWLLKSEEFDSLTRGLLGKFSRVTGAAVIQGFIDFLRSRGVRVSDPAPFFERYFCQPGFLTPEVPSQEALSDVKLAFDLACRLADLEIGQVAAVKRGVVVAVEGLEGTDKMIARAGELAGEGIAVAKVGRSLQLMAVDVPAVGLETVRSLAAAKAACLCIEAGKVAFFDQEEALAIARQAGLAILARPRDATEELSHG